MTATRTDTRDLRDPQKLGALIQYVAQDPSSQRGHKLTYSEAYDTYAMECDDVTHDDSMGKACVREYRAELQARVEEGDKYAEAALRDIDAGKGVQGFDEAG